MADKRIRIGIVGAGANTRSRHIPGFGAIPGVEIVGVVNRSRESSAKVASEFQIPKTYNTWQELVADPNLDAVCIGTWPNLHCEVTCAALAAGKHVLTEARMARNLAEARQMQQAAQAHPKLVTQIVPSPFGLVHHKFIHQLMKDGWLGNLREVVVIGADDQFWDYTEFLHWRQSREISGLNILTLGILHETVQRFIPGPTQVYAQTAIDEPTRPEPGKPGNLPVTVPDSVQILTRYANGARGIYHFSGTILYGPGKQIHLYGSRGTIKLKFAGANEELILGRAGDTATQTVTLTEAERGGWRVEAEFIGAIRGEEQVQFTDFASGVRYMEFIEAVAKSAEQNAVVKLPL